MQRLFCSTILITRPVWSEDLWEDQANLDSLLKVFETRPWCQPQRSTPLRAAAIVLDNCASPCPSRTRPTRQRQRATGF